ncbi:MAG: MOSC domain-containing protein [Calditrichia bacterium]
MNTTGKLEAIWIKRVRRGLMDSKPTAKLITNHGLEGNANQGGRRQVTLIEKEVWQAVMERLGAELDPSTRRANLMVSNFPLQDSRGKIVKIGNCLLEIMGETKPCNLMDESLMGLKDMLYANWGGGAFAKVLNDGEISVGDTIEWKE